MSLRTATIRLAYENPELRPVLLPLLMKQARDYQDYVYDMRGRGEQPKLTKEEWNARYGKGGSREGEKGEALSIAKEKLKGAPEPVMKLVEWQVKNNRPMLGSIGRDYLAMANGEMQGTRKTTYRDFTDAQLKQIGEALRHAADGLSEQGKY